MNHTVREQSAESMIKCKNCDENFEEKLKLMKHDAKSGEENIIYYLFFYAIKHLKEMLR